jgi:alpha-L-fucosidase
VAAPGPNLKLPVTDIHWKLVADWMDPDPPADFRHAPEEALEAFRDLKFGVRIHWGLYSVGGQKRESWPFLGMPPREKQRYQDLYRQWNPTRFDADAWMQLFHDAGMRVFAFTTKHHEGFSLFDTRTRVKRRVQWDHPDGPRIVDCDMAYSVMESPFRRDIVAELCDAARRRGISIDLYFSHPDWFDADFRPYCYHPANTPGMRDNPREWGGTPWGNPSTWMTPDQSPEEAARMMARHRAQLVELLTRYGKIDMLCLDMWLGPRVWRETRETLEELRRIQPRVMLRCRGIGSWGDYYTPEGFVPGNKENTDMPWMVIYPLGRSFSYEPDAGQHKGGPWIIRNLVDAVAKGGNFMVGVGPDEHGEWHASVRENLAWAGSWLRVNGEGIYGTRPREGDLWHEGDAVRFTRSKDGAATYAFAMGWPGATLALRSVTAGPDTEVRLLGVSSSLPWRNEPRGGILIEIPEALQDESARPCREIFCFKIAAGHGRAI